MPELPEVETVARELDRALRGCTVARASLTMDSLYRRGSLGLDSLVGKKIIAVKRLGKAILFYFEPVPPSPELVLAVHLGMTGRLIAAPKGATERETGKHLHARFGFASGTELHYFDPRRFGYLYVGQAEGIGKTLNVGPDPFQMKPGALARALQNRRAPIKSLLLNQRILAGLGNIYADEALCRAGMHPLTSGRRAARHAGNLIEQIRFVLRRAIRHGGTTLRDYRRPDGSRGNYLPRLAVYGRAGENCRKCGEKIKRIELGGRGTHFCPRCQKKPRRR